MDDLVLQQRANRYEGNDVTVELTGSKAIVHGASGGKVQEIWNGDATTTQPLIIENLDNYTTLTFIARFNDNSTAWSKSYPLEFIKECTTTYGVMVHGFNNEHVDIKYEDDQLKISRIEGNVHLVAIYGM